MASCPFQRYIPVVIPSFSSSCFSLPAAPPPRPTLGAGCLMMIYVQHAKLTAYASAEQFRVLREKGTESPYTGKYDTHAPASGIYACAACSAPLYKATHKFKSGCGWPAYFDSIPGAVTRHTDKTFGMTRTEIVCSSCGGHLGHVFKGEKYPTPTDERHCVNSVSLRFSEDEGTAAKV